MLNSAKSLGLLLLALWFGRAPAEAGTLILTSRSFAGGGDIPARHTCEGGDVSPELSWSGVPAGTRTLVLIVDDPDAPDPATPQRTWVHWVVYDIPPSVGEIAEGATALPTGARAGRNDWDRASYRGPCPPIGRHRYFHRLYALDIALPDLHSPTRAQLEAAMKGHVLESAELVGRYEKSGP